MPGWLATVLLVVARITALVAVVPGMQSQYVPWRIRMVLIMTVSLAVICVTPCYSESSVASADMLKLLVQEASIGISLALVPAVLLFGLQLASESLQGMTGLPTDSSSTLTPGAGLPRLCYIVALTTFFCASGHRCMFQALLDSFRWMPVGSVSSLTTTKDVLLDVFSQSFQLGVRSVAPVAASLAMGILTLAAINRVIPQLSYFTVGMSVQTTVLLASLVIFLGAVGLFLESSFVSSTESWPHVWSAALGRSMP